MHTTPHSHARSRTPALLCAAGALLLAPSACGSQGSEGSAAGDAAREGQEAGAVVSAAPRPLPGRAWVVFGADTVQAEVARTDDERARGLMYRDDLPDGTGMLFVFPDQSIRSFWMQDTQVALDIAFIDASFRVVDIQHMEPLTTDRHESPAPIMYALEVPRGWFEAQGIEVGATAEVIFGG
jgi:hypothetical protein